MELMMMFLAGGAWSVAMVVLGLNLYDKLQDRFWDNMGEM